MGFKSNILAMRTGMAAEPAQLTVQPKAKKADHDTHLAAAQSATDLLEKRSHIFRALSSLKRVAPADATRTAPTPAKRLNTEDVERISGLSDPTKPKFGDPAHDWKLDAFGMIK